MKFGYICASFCSPDKDDQKRELLLHGVAPSHIWYAQTDNICEKTKILRKELSKMQPGDVLVITSLDRIAGSAKQAAWLFSSLIKQRISVDVLDLGMIDDSPAGQLMLNTLKKVAMMEKIEYRERSLAGKRRAKLENKNYREGRPHALITDEKRQAYLLLKKHTYQQVSVQTGLSVSTLKRIKNRIEHQ